MIFATTYALNMLWDLFAEASDQNFIDDEIEGEKASRMRSSKKMKTT